MPAMSENYNVACGDRGRKVETIKANGLVNKAMMSTDTIIQ